MVQFAVPDADQATGLWTPTPLFSRIDEGGTGDDVVITSDDNTNGDNADVRLSDVTDPGIGTGHMIRFRGNKASSGGHMVNAIIELWEGIPGTGSLRATLTLNNINETEIMYTYTLQASEADAISDYTNLYLRISRQGDTGGPPPNRRSLVCEFSDLQVPDAPVGRIMSSLADAGGLAHRGGIAGPGGGLAG